MFLGCAPAGCELCLTWLCSGGTAQLCWRCWAALHCLCAVQVRQADSARLWTNCLGHILSIYITAVSLLLWSAGLTICVQLKVTFCDANGVELWSLCGLNSHQLQQEAQGLKKTGEIQISEKSQKVTVSSKLFKGQVNTFLV